MSDSMVLKESSGHICPHQMAFMLDNWFRRLIQHPRKVAGEYVKAMWMMLQQEDPDDYVIATGQCHSVQEFAEETFSLLDLDWRDHIRFDRRYLRPTEVNTLQGDATKAHDLLGWRQRVDLDEGMSRTEAWLRAEGCL